MSFYSCYFIPPFNIPNQNAILKKPAGMNNQNSMLTMLNIFPIEVFLIPKVCIAELKPCFK